MSHALDVAYTLAEVGLDDSTISAALLHDVPHNEEEQNKLKEEFGEEIADMVKGVAKLGKMQFSTIEEKQVEDYRKMFLAMGKDIRVIILKLSDILQNMRKLKKCSREQQISYSKETMDIYAPLANRLGLYSMKWELEDLAFKYLYPSEYHTLVEGINKKRDERLKFIEKIMGDIKVALKKERIDAEVTGRAKHLYSIYRKMLRDDKSLDQIYDLFALRILVNSVKDCYAALSVVHELYSPMPGRFKDYIAVPKPNMYQSIHTTLLGEKGTPFEVQIRTWDMHRVAEYGIAAHWAYKETNYFGKKQSVKVEEDKLAWLRETLEWQKDMQDPQEFLETLKTELFEDEVYVFTPKGAIKILPSGSIPIDFAYSIHEQIGHHMTGCKINNKMMPITTKLKSGDIVEIITSDNSKGPSRDWLKFVKSTGAKNKIKNWFKKEYRTENIERGKEQIEKEIKRIGLNHTDLFKQEYLNVVLDKYNYKTIDDMYSAVGFGAISQIKIVTRLLQEYKKDHQDEQEKDNGNLKKATNKKSNRSGIEVKGIENCLVKLSKCCNPLPGDDIIGYITKGRGVSVHRKDCINIQKLMEKEENAIIEVNWQQEVKEKYSVSIEVLANDRNGLLVDILNEIKATKASLIGVTTKTTKDRIAIININIEIDNIEELNKLIKAVKKVDSVFEIKR